MLRMTDREWKRLDVVRRLERGMLTVEEASGVLGLSARQVRRLRCGVAERGTDGVVHGNTGRPPANRLGDTQRARVLRLARKKYIGFNDHHLTEKLVEVEQVAVSRASVQRILR